MFELNGRESGSPDTLERNSDEVKPVIGYYGYWTVLTYLSAVSAVLGMYFAVGGNIRAALVCLMLSGLCDMFDGPAARLKKRTEREKNYGIQIDAFADIISFGALPVVIGYAVSSGSQAQNGMLAGIAIFTAYLLASLIRLAYFCVTETELKRKNARRVYFEGLPTTSVALIIPFAYSVCSFFDISLLPAVYNALLAVLAVAFVLRVKIPKPRGLFLLILALIGLSVLFSILLFG